MCFRWNSHSCAALLTAGCLSLGAGSLYADTIISAQFENSDGFSFPAVTYSGVEPDAAAADPAFANSNVWNALQAMFSQSGAVSFSNLLDSTGANTGAALSISHIDGALNSGSKLPFTFVAATTNPQGKNSQTFTFSGLPPGQSFTLFLYALNSFLYPNDNRGDEVFTVNGSSFDTANGNPSSESHNAAVTGMLVGVTSSTGTIDGTWASGPDNGVPGGEISWSGFQLAIGTTVSAVPEPSALFLLACGVVPLLLVARRRSRVTKR
jgi:hypothetical protein